MVKTSYQSGSKPIKFVTIMPCYDKKLEAVRPTMLLPNSDNSLRQVMEVDTVLATHEIADLLSKKAIDFRDIKINGLLE